MANFYMDTDSGSDASAGTTWATAKLTVEGLLAVMAAGDTGYIQGAAVDDSAINRILTSPGTATNPVKLIGVKDATTNEPPVPADCKVLGTDTLTKIRTTARIDTEGTASVYGLDFDVGDRFQGLGAWCFYRGQNRFGSSRGRKRYYDCELYWLSGQNMMFASEQIVHGGSSTFTGTPARLIETSCDVAEFIGHDLSALPGSTAIGAAATGATPVINCRLPASFTRATTFPNPESAVEIISSGNAAGDSDNYEFENQFGTVLRDDVVNRTGGASDATGAYTFELDPKTDATLEGTDAAIASPFFGKKVVGDGTTAMTFTVHFANNTADLTEGEIQVQFFTVSESNTPQHDLSFAVGLPNHFIGTATALTDDTTSTWNGATLGFPQSASITMTPDFEGKCYARVILSKRNSGPVYIDPKVIVT